MNYIEQLNGFWAKAETAEITGNDIAVYFALVKYCNSLNWLNPFICHWHIVCQYSKVSKNTYYKSIKKLHDLEFINYREGKTSRLSPKITILKFENKKGIVKEQEGNKKGTSKEQEGNLYKLLNSKTIKLINKHSSMVNENLKRWIDQETKKPNKEIPSYQEFLDYALEKKPDVSKEKLRLKYESWKVSGWQTGKGTKIKNWKSTLLNTLPYLQKEKSSAKKEKPKSRLDEFIGN